MATGKQTGNGPRARRQVRAVHRESLFPEAVECGGLTCTGAVGGTNETGKVVSRTALEQAARALDNLKAILEANGQGLEHVIRCTVYLVEMRDRTYAEKALRNAFGENLPAASFIGVGALPGGQMVAVEALAVRPPPVRDVNDFMG